MATTHGIFNRLDRSEIRSYSTYEVRRNLKGNRSEIGN